MKRRNFLLGTTAITLGSLATGCSRTTPLQIELLKGSVPVQMVSRFRREQSTPAMMDFIPRTQLQDLYKQLQRGKEETTDQSNQRNQQPPDLVMIGDYWLSEAVQQNLLQPLDPQVWEQWNQLPQQWQDLVRRSPKGEFDPEGQIWAAPYRWGTTVIAYRLEEFEALGWTPNDWEDLWREEIRDRFSLLDSARETIGLTLKKLGFSYNTLNLDQVAGLEDELQQLHRHVKLYDSDTYLKPLITGDTWLAVGWSSDFPEKVRRQHKLGVVVPASGTALWSDLWVQPISEKPPSETTLIQQWIDFCWKPEIATQMSILTDTTSPIVSQLSPSQLPEALQQNSLLLPKAEILEQSEFLRPLPKLTLTQYQELWKKIRSS
ncbi:MAG: extracellular solute-binding protein [Cyanobacteriota bacterium]|nr:extracellular solute-binding protein [Cyanobacteriota bacterium]